MSKLSQIIEGWSNHIFDNPEVKKLAEARANICATCPENKSNICNKCGCYLPAKTKSPQATCPIEKW